MNTKKIDEMVVEKVREWCVNQFGVEPVRIKVVGGGYMKTMNHKPGVRAAMAFEIKFPFLGKEKFKVIASRIKYVYGYFKVHEDDIPGLTEYINELYLKAALGEL